MFDEVGGSGRALGALGAVAGALGLGAASCAVALGAALWWWQRLPEQAPPSRYAFEVPQEARRHGGIDAWTVHTALWPAWVVARDAERAAAGDALLAALAPDPALVGVAEEIVAGAALGDREAFVAQIDTWNAALAGRGVPWALGEGMAGDGAYVKAYYVVGRPRLRLDEREVPVALGLRADRLNVREGWLGIADDIGESQVVLDRVADYVFDRVWPALGPTDDGPADDGPVAISLRQDLSRALPPEIVEVLTRTAPLRRSMLQAAAAVAERGRGCGSGFRMRLDWDGLTELGRLAAYAARDAGQDCPGITSAEVHAIGRATLQLRGEPSLPEALEALVGYVARHVAVHEARHALDHEDWGAGTPPPCEGCGVDGRARIELSAYTSAMASPDAVVAWAQACELLEQASGGSATQALQRLLQELDAPCTRPAPPDLAARATAAGRRWFGRPESATLPGEAFARLPFRIGAAE
jgi:hypothetical protein